MISLPSLVMDNLPKLLTSIAATSLVSLFTYLYGKGAWTRDHRRAKLFEAEGDRFMANRLWDQAAERFRRSIEIYEKDLNRTRLFNLHQKVGKCKQRLGQHEEALQDFLQCEVLWEQIKREVKPYELFYELAELYLEKGSLDKAETYIFKSLEVLRSMRSPRLPIALTMAARIEKQRGRMSDAEHLYREAIDQLDALEDTLGLASVAYDLAELKRDQPEIAKAYYIRSRDCFARLGSPRAAEIEARMLSLAQS